MSSLATHVKDVHGVNQESSEHVFHSHDEFLRWKNSKEESTHSNYVTHGGTSVKDSVKYAFFIVIGQEFQNPRELVLEIPRYRKHPKWEQPPQHT